MKTLLFKGITHILIFFPLAMLAQTSIFSGTYTNPDASIALRFKSVGNEYQGVLQTMGGNFAMKGTTTGNRMSGTIFAVNGPVPFTADKVSGGLTFSAYGYTESYQLLSPNHELDNIDLAPYMTSEPVVSPATEDYDYSYSQSSNGQANEQYRTQRNPVPQVQSPYPALNDTEMQNLIAGSQLVYYTRTSYVNDNTASTITYVNFCANGAFQISYDGSFSVEGDYGGNAQGATYGRQSGTWQLVKYENQPAVYMVYRDGTTGINPINKQRVLEGRWRVGNMQYAIQRGKARCN